LTLKRNVAANYFSQAWKAIMGVVFVPFYVKYIGVEAYGLIGIFAILQSGLVLLDMGMKPALGREMARFTAGAHNAQSIRDLLRSIEIISAVTSIGIALCIWGAADWLASDWVTSTDLPTAIVTHSFAAMGVVIALRFVESIYISSIVGLQRQVLESVVSSSIATARGLGAVAILAWVSPTIEAFFVWQGFVSLITVPILAAIVYRELPPAPRSARFSLPAITGIWRFAAGVMLITLLAVLLTQVDKILLSRLLPLKIFAFYALAGVLTNALYMLTSPISAAFYPQFTELITRHDVVALRRTYHQAAQLTAVVVGGAAVVLIIFADSVLRLWTANPQLTMQVTPLLKVLALGTLVNALMGIPYQMQLAHGWTALTVKINVVAVLLLIPAIFYAVPLYGAIGAAWIWVLLNAGYLVVDIYFMHRRVMPTEKWRWYGQDVAAPLLTATVTALLFRYAMPKETGKVVEIGMMVLVSGCVVLTAAIVCPLLRPQLARHAKAVVKQVWSQP
jgi:O-antigen/teichoic acid export membrane protein